MPAARLQYVNEIYEKSNRDLTTIDPHALARIAAEHSAFIRLSVRLGDFVSEGDVLGAIESSRKIPSSVAFAIRAAVATAHRRSNHQDPGFGLQQLTDIALKALSPGVNDTTTAVMSVNYIGTVIRKLAHEEIRPQVFCDKDGHARLYIPYPSFEEYVQGSLGVIRAVATTHVPVLQSLVDALDRARRATKHEDRLRSLDRLSEQLRRASGGVPDPDDRNALDQAIQQVRAGLLQRPPLRR